MTPLLLCTTSGGIEHSGSLTQNGSLAYHTDHRQQFNIPVVLKPRTVPDLPCTGLLMALCGLLFMLSASFIFGQFFMWLGKIAASNTFKKSAISKLIYFLIHNVCLHWTFKIIFVVVDFVTFLRKIVSKKLHLRHSWRKLRLVVFSPDSLINYYNL